MRSIFGPATPVAARLERAILAIGRLDTAVFGHPLTAAWAYRTRLEAVCRHTETDGARVEPDALAALLAGLRPTIEPAASVADRGARHDALAHAARLYAGMLAMADVDQMDAATGNCSGDRTETAAALIHYRQSPADGPALTDAADALRAGLDAGLARGPLRAALPRYLAERQITRTLLPCLAGAAALHGDAPWANPASWYSVFLDSIADEADASRRRLETMSHAWSRAQAALAARGDLPNQRKVRAGAALPRVVDLLAATPLLGPAQLARLLGCTLRGAAKMLQALEQLGIATEATGRSSHRLYAMTGLAGLRSHTAGPRRAETGMRRLSPAEDNPPVNPAAATPATTMARYASRPASNVDLLALVADTDRANARIARLLDDLANGSPPPRRSSPCTE